MMLRKKKKKEDKPLTLFTNTKLLHSKSTYFYFNGKSSGKPCHDIFANGFWVRLSNGMDPFLEKGVQPPKTGKISFGKARFPERNGFRGGRNLYRKNTGWRTSYALPVFCITALLLVLGACVNPVLPDGGGEGVYAAESSTSSGSSGMSVALTMNDPDETTLVNNAKTGGVNYISTGFKVKTENVDGYNVYVQTAPGSTNKLTNGTLSIDFVTTETPTSSFTDNTWGYAVDDTGASAANLKYSPVPDTAASALNPAYTSDKSNDERNFTLNFAAKFAADATPGHYTSGVLLSVAAGAEEVTGLGLLDIDFMQDMTTDICSASSEGDTKRLYDMRDGNKYWVAKLNDGRCWMTQNLAYNPSGLKDVRPAVWGSDNSASQYYNPGLYVYTTPTTQNSCHTASNDIPTLGHCSSYGWVDVSAWNASDDPNFSGIVDTTNKVYDAHYLSGNYYSWAAVTNGSDVAFGNSGGDGFCPVGWSFPFVSNYSDLFTSYGTNSGLLYGTQDIRTAPLYFVYSGYIDSNSMVNVGSGGYYWLGVAKSAEYGYSTNITNTVATFFSGSSERYRGLSMRCVAR